MYPNRGLDWAETLENIGKMPFCTIRFEHSDLLVSARCMPGPISALINSSALGKGEFCSEVNDTTGELISQCDNSLYRKSPTTADYQSLTISKVYPGPECNPTVRFQYN